mmetsp:Transcript_14408/g.58372  ORF Transcript_14408/g.58372 Transcript_14408/m.58372 type:complete len:195 (-) Transcript_14408:673-1257(-)
MGAVLLQRFDDGEHPVAYFSKRFSGAEPRYSTVRTDHNPLRFLHSQKELTKRQARYINRLLPFSFTIDYKKGKENIADALSRHTLQQLGLSSIATNHDWQQAYLRDPEFAAIYKEPEKYAGQGFRRRDDLLYRYYCICVPENLRNDLLRSYHDEPTGGHFGITKTISLLKRKYYWPTLKRDIEDVLRTDDHRRL